MSNADTDVMNWEVSHSEYNYNLAMSREDEGLHSQSLYIHLDSRALGNYCTVAKGHM